MIFQNIKVENIELNKIYNENCLATMNRMPNKFVDLVVTSPPYDKLRKYHGISFDFKAVAQELYRTIRPGGVVVWVMGDATVKGSETGTSFEQALYFRDIGFNLYDTMIYRKTNPPPLNHRRYEQSFEYMFVLTRGKLKTWNPIMVDCKYAGQISGKTRSFYHKGSEDFPEIAHNNAAPIKDRKIDSNVWDIRPGGGVKGHPAQFPEELAERHIATWSNAGDLVYDPFMGAGTTAKMALLNNRKFLGSEISEKYCQIANNRIAEHLNNEMTDE